MNEAYKSFDGDTDLHKWLNWYLTRQFISGSKTIHKDECLSEARKILTYIDERYRGNPCQK